MQRNIIPKAGLKIAITSAIAQIIERLTLKRDFAHDFLRELNLPSVNMSRVILNVKENNA